MENESCLLSISDCTSSVLCNGTTYEPFEVLTYLNMYFWIYLGGYVFLVLISGLLSGLKVAVFSLDYLTLKVLSTAGKQHEQKYAKRIMPLVRQQHLLLVTFLVSNAAILVSLPILLHKITSHVIAIVVSVTAVLFFGEILPHAIISRCGLAMGGIFSPLILLFMIILFPISWPLSKLLDCLLGSECGTFFRRAELSSLVDFHKCKDSENEDPLTEDEIIIIKNVLTMRDKVVGQICTPIKDMFALDTSDILDNSLADLILKKCLFEVPVFSKTKENLLGLLPLKNLIAVDPDNNLLLDQVFKKFQQPLYKVSEDVDLYTALNFFQLGKSRMFAVVSNTHEEIKNPELVVLDASDKVIGCVTLKDVIQELIQGGITNKPIANENVKKRILVGKAKAARQHIKKQQLSA